LGRRDTRRTRSTITTAIAVDRIRKMTDGVVQDVEDAFALKTALESGNETIREIRGDGPPLSFYGAHGYEAIKRGLTISLALTLAKLFDPATLYVSRARNGRRGGANKSDIISIPLLVRLLKQRRCQAFLGTEARGWTPALDHMDTVNQVTAISAANEAVAAYDDFRRTHDGRSAARILKTFRNRQLAHRLLDKPALPPRYRDLFLLLGVAGRVAGKARLAVTGVSWDVEETGDVWRTHSKAFWEPALKGVIEAER
jgi:AbiU2